MALWSGRFTEGADAFTQRFGASLPVDQRLYAEDIAGSIAHADMLAAQGIIATADAEAIAEGLQGILADITSGALTFDVMESEDIHMAIEAELTRRVGDAGARLHTGRSRNDQVATDTRLYAKRRAGELMAANVALREALIAQAEANFDVILPGYTHLQHAQPVLFSHHMLAYVQMLARDWNRLAAARDAADACPLGAAALAGHHLSARSVRHRGGARLRPPHPELAGRRVRPRLPARSHLRLQRVVLAPVAFVRGNRAVVVGGVRLHRAVGRLLHRLLYHAPEEEPRFRGAHPRQVRAGSWAIWWPS